MIRAKPIKITIELTTIITINLTEASLSWESWEQFNLWRLISAQAVPIEEYIQILPRLNTKSK